MNNTSEQQPMSAAQLQEIRERLQAATRGYWMAGDFAATLRRNDDAGPRAVTHVQSESSSDVNLLTHAYVDLSGLLVEVERLQNETTEAALAVIRIHRLLSKCKAEWDSKEQALQKSIAEHLRVIAKLEARADGQGK